MIRMSLMGRRLFVTAAVFAAAIGCAITARATVLVNDTWLDGTRTDPAAPTYSEFGTDSDLDGDLESVWYNGGGATFAPVGPGGPLRLDSTADMTQQNSFTTYFAAEATPVTLAVGQTLKVTWVFTPTDVNSTDTGQSLKIGIINSPPTGRISSDISPPADAYSGYASFINMTSANLANANPFQLRERSTPALAGSQLSNAGVWAGLANGATTGNPGFTSGTQYTYTFEATRMPADELDIVMRLAGTGLDGDGLAEVLFTDTTPNGGSFTFDTFAIRSTRATQTARIFDTSLVRVEVVPEPASIVMLGLGGILSVWWVRRRKAG